MRKLLSKTVKVFLKIINPGQGDWMVHDLQGTVVPMSAGKTKVWGLPGGSEGKESAYNA